MKTIILLSFMIYQTFGDVTVKTYSDPVCKNQIASFGLSIDKCTEIETDIWLDIISCDKNEVRFNAYHDANCINKTSPVEYFSFEVDECIEEDNEDDGSFSIHCSSASKIGLSYVVIFVLLNLVFKN